MVEEMQTKHCPKCDSQRLGYEIDIFKNRDSPEYYTGDVSCDECNHKFKDKDIEIKTWVLKE